MVSSQIGLVLSPNWHWYLIISNRFCAETTFWWSILNINAFLQETLSFKCCLGVCLIHISIYSERLVFIIFISMSRPRCIYIVSMWSIFHFYLHFHYNYSHYLRNTDAFVLFLFLEYFLLFLDDTMDEEFD